MSNRCETCAAYAAGDDECGYCRRRAPGLVVLGEYEVKGAWPPVRADEWCAEFTAAPIKPGARPFAPGSIRDKRLRNLGGVDVYPLDMLLKKHGVYTVRDILRLGRDGLLGIPGVGARKVGRIADLLAMHGEALADRGRDA